MKSLTLCAAVTISKKCFSHDNVLKCHLYNENEFYFMYFRVDEELKTKTESPECGDGGEGRKGGGGRKGAGYL